MTKHKCYYSQVVVPHKRLGINMALHLKVRIPTLKFKLCVRNVFSSEFDAMKGISVEWEKLLVWVPFLKQSALTITKQS